MKRVPLLGACVIIAGLLLSPAFGGETLWVTSEGAKLKTAPSAVSDTVADLSIGTELTVIQPEDRWYRVRTLAGKEGWIYRGKVSDAAPKKEAETADNLFAGMQGSTITADEAHTSRSIRGLSKETEQYARQRGTPEVYQKALDAVLSRKVTETQLDVFLRNGKIGEYAF